MTTCECDLIRTLCRPQEPLPTDVLPRGHTLFGVRAVLFDVYGTVLISASGEINGTDSAAVAVALRDAFAAAGIAPTVPATTAATALLQTIQDCHGIARAQGLEYPEVDIVDVWKQTLARLAAGGAVPPAAAQIDARRLALEYEIRANPVWPMPGLTECLQQLHDRGLWLGILSNAQFYTPLLFPALLGRTLEELGFDPDFQWYSYQCGRAKPDVWLVERARDTLAERGVAAGQVLFVGNDLLNDILPATRVGFRTAVFAGDARSFRPRSGDPRVAAVVPDLVITDLAGLPSYLAGD